MKYFKILIIETVLFDNMQKTDQKIRSYNLYRLKSINKHRLKRNEVLKYLGGKCVYCGNNDLEVLEGDHINQDRKSW